MAADEPLAFQCDRAADIARDGTVAPENLRATIVDVERVDSKRGHGEVPGLAAARGTGNHDHARTAHRGPQPVSRVVSDSGRMSGGSSVDTRSPLTLMTP